MLRENKKIILILILLALASCIALLFWLSTEVKAPDSMVKDGGLNLSQWDGESILYLSGDWDFYWNRFLDENDLSQNPKPDLKAAVPSVWNKFTVNGKRLGGMGYATYRLRVTGAEAGSPLAMRVVPFSTAYEMYVDDGLVAFSGKVSTSEEGFIPKYTVQTVTFTPNHSEFDIIIHISNFVYARGGAWYAVTLGNPEKIDAQRQIIFARDFFVISFLLLISAYSIFLFFLRRDKGYLLFISLCVAFLLRTVINGNYLINVTFPSITFRTVVLIDYITLYGLTCLCVWLCYYIYPKNLSRVLVKCLFFYAVAITVITLVVPIYIFTNFIYAAELIAAGAGVYGVVKMFLLTLKRNLEACFMFIGGTVLTVCIFHDVLCENNIFRISYMEYSPIGFLALAAFLQCMFWVRYDRSNRENERMLLELNEADKRERKMELQYLKSQIRPHFVNNALNAIISISRTDADRSRKLLIEFSKYLRNCYDVQNLDENIPIEDELSFVRAYVALELARFSESLHVSYDIDSIFLMIPPLILQPLVENAIVHGLKEKSENGQVVIYVKDCGDFVKVGVSDNGVGIDPALVAALLSEEHRGTGIGIYNINRRMKRLYNTGLHIENRPEGGTNAYVVIPKGGES